jgi:hypothetical protein
MARSTAAAPWRSFANEEFPMTDTANHLVPEQGKFRRALAAVGAFLQSLGYTSFDYVGRSPLAFRSRRRRPRLCSSSITRRESVA